MMSREIKFRAWDKDCNRWWTNEEVLSLLLLQGRTLNGTADSKDKLDRYVIEQYTGYETIPNPNIANIYEGDLFAVEDGGIEQVVFDHGSWYLGDEKLEDFNSADGIKYCKYVGNIHENPELLAEGKE
jgi:hypothetical protein